MHTTESDPLKTPPQRRRTAPLIAAAIISAIVTVFLALVSLVAAATTCGFAGGRCETGSGGPGSPVVLAGLAVAASWAVTLWIARHRGRATPLWQLYLVGIGGPLAIGAATTVMIVAGAS